jgi:hypothetical protein
MEKYAMANNGNLWPTLDIKFPIEGLTESLQVERIADNHYRIHSVPILADILDLNDVIEVEPKQDHVIFLRLAQKAGWRTLRFILLPEFEGGLLREIEGRVLAVGGQWETTPSLGALVVCIPGNAKYDPTSDIQALIKRDARPQP